MKLWSTPAPNALIAAAVIGVLLVIGSVVIAVMRHLQPEKDWSELEQRIKSWWTICIFFLGAVLLGGAIALLLFAFVSYLALKEYLSRIPTRRVDRRVLFWAYLAIPFQYWWVYVGWYGMFIIFIPVYMFLIIPMRLVSLQDTKGFLRAAGSIQWGLMITVFCLSHVAWLFAFPEQKNISGGAAGLVIYLVGITEFNDVAQYLWGKAFGKRKIIPHVSPNKTWAGFIGGLASSTLLSVAIAPVLTFLSLTDAIFLGAALAFFGFMGDVTVSAVKRDLGIKNSGSLLPGHGGILDRVDSLMFTAPLFLHFIRYYYF